MSTPLLPLPIDLSTFDVLRNNGYLYVDKTQHAYNLITKGRRYFLSRPRRFGKSLLVSMLKAVLLGNRPLFDGLWIAHSDYQWKQHGVITLDFSGLDFQSGEELAGVLCKALARVAHSYELTVILDGTNPGLDLTTVVEALYKRFGKVAILIDEYDSPILKTLHNVEQAQLIRDRLHGFFSVIKSLDEYINFVFITGVSSFAKAGIFSGMNNLQIITMRDNCADICGYTDAELDHYFKSYIQAWANKDAISYAEQREKIKHWYNGYRFSSNVTTVYNPFSLMNALYENKFENFWFRSGTPKFLVEQLKRKQNTDFDEFDAAIYPGALKVSQDSLGIFDVGATPLPALMFQTGYLTISDYDSSKNMYRLGYPNHEVEKALQIYLLAIFTHLNTITAEDMALQLQTAFQSHDAESIVQVLKRLFAHIPYQIHAKEEKFYHALLQMAFIVAGMNAHAEYSTSHGRIDMVIEEPTATYIVEVKFKARASKALAQIEERKYYEKFMNKGKKLILLGLAFTRGEAKFDIEYAVKILASSKNT